MGMGHLIDASVRQHEARSRASGQHTKAQANVDEIAPIALEDEMDLKPTPSTPQARPAP